MNVLNKLSSGIVTSELILLWGRQLDMVSLRTGGPSLPALSPGALVTTQTERFIWEVHGPTPCISFQVLVFVHLETLGDHLWVERDVAEEIGSVCTVRVCLQGRWSAERGKRPDTTHLGNCLHSYFLPSSFSQTSRRVLGIQKLGGLWACRTCSSSVDCGGHGAARVFLVIVVWCPCQRATGTN